MRPFRLGLTGSIGMGKSTTAAMFVAEGIPVWDADAAVHRLYACGGGAAAVLMDDFPEAITNGAVSRERLKAVLAREPARLPRLEALVHPLVARDREIFLAGVTARLVVLDIPLLFETGAEAACDATLLVTAPPALQRARVLARPGMSAAQFDLILSRQMPDAQKRALATHVVETLTPDQVRAYVRALIAYLLQDHARDRS